MVESELLKWHFSPSLVANLVLYLNDLDTVEMTQWLEGTLKIPVILIKGPISWT